MDKQNIINDILQMSETNPALAAQQQHRAMGPTSKSHIYMEINTPGFPLMVDYIILQLHIVLKILPSWGHKVLHV